MCKVGRRNLTFRTGFRHWMSTQQGTHTTSLRQPYPSPLASVSPPGKHHQQLLYKAAGEWLALRPQWMASLIHLSLTPSSCCWPSLQKQKSKLPVLPPSPQREKLLCPQRAFSAPLATTGIYTLIQTSFQTLLLFLLAFIAMDWEEESVSVLVWFHIEFTHFCL